MKDKAGGAGIAFEALCHHALQQRTLFGNLEATLSFADRDFLGELLRQIGLEVKRAFRAAPGLPDWPGLNFECCGGRLYPTRDAPSSAICLLLGCRVPRERHDSHRFGGQSCGAFGVTTLQGRLKSLARRGGDGVATG